jgi:PAS domain S-box-containing protein
MKSAGLTPPLLPNRAAGLLSLLAAAALMAVVGFAAWLSYRGYSEAEYEFAARRAEDMALILQARARDTLRSVDDAVMRIKHTVEREGFKVNLNQLMQDHGDIAEYIAVGSVADAEGRLVRSTLPIPSGANIADLAHFQAHVTADTGAPFINRPVLGRVSGKWSFHMTRRINRADGGFGGVAIIAVDLSYWEQLLRESHLGDSGAVVLAGDDGAARAVFAGAAENGSRLMQADWGLLGARAGDGVPVRGRVIARGLPDGSPRTWAYHRLEGFPMLVAVAVDERATAARLLPIRKWYVGGSLAIMALIALIAAALLLFFSRQRQYEAERARMTESWRQSEERFRAVFEQAAVGMGLRDLGRRNAPWLQVNRRLCEFLGYTEDELLRLPSFLIDVPEDEGLAADRDALMAQGGISTYSREKQYLRKDGTRVWGHLTVTVLHRPDGGPSQALVIVQDINDRKLAEEAARKGAERLRILTAHTTEGLALYDRDERLVFFNEPYRRMLELPDLQVGWTFGQIAHARAVLLHARGQIGDVAAFEEERQRLHGSPGQQFERRRADGGYHLVRKARAPSGEVVVSCVDITEIRRREAELQDSERRFRTIFEHAGLGITLRPSGDRRLGWIDVNEKFCAMTGYSREELLSMSPAQITIESESEFADINSERLARGKIGSYAGERRIRRKDGSLLWVEVIVTEVPDVSGLPSLTIGTYMDISARKLAEERARQSEGWFRTMFDHAGIGISLRPAHDRKLPWIAVNDKFCEMTGYSRDELLKMSTEQITPPDGQAFAMHDNRRLLSGEVDSYEREKQLLCKGGSRIWVALSVALLHDAEGRPQRIMSTYQDITARKMAEEMLRRSEQRFRAIFDHAGIGITLGDARDRTKPWLDVNSRFCEMTGYSREEALRMSSADITATERVEGALRDRARLLSGEASSYSVEKRIRRKDGGWSWVALSVAILPDAEDRPGLLITTYQDISVRREVEERLRAIIAAEPECVATVSPAGELLDMNPAGLRMLEAASLEDLRRHPFLGRVARPFRRAFVRLRRRVLKGESGMLEFEATGLKGTKLWLEIHAAPLHDASGGIAALLGIARDVTGQRRAREALAAERNLLRTVIDNLPDRIRVKDRNQRYVMANAAWIKARVPGGAESDIIGRSDADFYPPDRAAFYGAEDHQVITTGVPSSPREIIDGDLDNPRWFVTTKLPLLDADRNVIGLVAISRDITEARQRALEVEKLNAALESRVAERTAQLTAANEELEAFASSVSHDLRAPLRQIDGFAAALLEDCGERLDAAGKEYLGRIRAAVSRMSGLMEDLLRLSRVTRAELGISDADLSALAGEIAAELQREHPRRRVTFRVQPGLRADADPGLLRAALTNLIGNAWKFTGKQPEAVIEFGARQREGATVYFVRDNGAGFDMGRAGRLFGAFQRLHNERDFPGTGIGLAIVRRVVRRHGGEIWAESSVGGGATFYFTLGKKPEGWGREQTLPARQRLAAEPSPVSGAGVTRVLLVDDDPDVLLLAERALRPDGHELLKAASAEEALALLSTQRVSAVVSDFSMPGMNGAELLAEVARLQPDTLRVIVSGQDLNPAMEAGLRNGEIHRCFRKQTDFGPLRDCVREGIARRAVLRL